MNLLVVGFHWCRWWCLWRSYMLMCHDFMALSMLKTMKLCKYLGQFVRCDVIFWLFCRKTGLEVSSMKIGKKKKTSRGEVFCLDNESSGEVMTRRLRRWVNSEEIKNNIWSLAMTCRIWLRALVEAVLSKKVTKVHKEYKVDPSSRNDVGDDS